MLPARGALSTTLVTALVTGALVALLTWAAATGPDDLVRGGGSAPPTRATAAPSATPGTTAGCGAPTTPPSATTAEQTAPGCDPRPLHDVARPPADGAWWGWLAVVVGCLGLGYLAVRAGQRLWRAWRDRDVAAPEPDEVSFDPLPPAELARAVADDATEQRRLLLGGTPRNGIVRCWDRFEQLASRAGLAREPWETPAEFTLRFFDLLEADARPVQRLATLYREARFSDHPLGETDRDAATAALGAIHDSLAARAPVGPVTDR